MEPAKPTMTTAASEPDVLDAAEQESEAAHTTEQPQASAEAETETVAEPEATAEPEIAEPITPTEPDWREQYIRIAAEYDNFRKRSLREKEELGQHTRAAMLRTLVPLLNDFGRAIEAARKSENLDALREGLGSLERKLNASYPKLELEEVGAVGDAFNAELHEAILSRPATEGETSGTVVEVLSRGFRYRNTLIQEAKVIVAE
jgi:molecular chaperone GrpE